MFVAAGLLALAVVCAAGTPPYANSCTFNFTGGPRLPYPYCDPSQPIEARLADLVSRMTAEEKCAALDTGNPRIARLGLPSLPGGEGLHGVACGCGHSPNSTGCPTSFPHATALGASFDNELYKAVGAAVGLEARGLNNNGGARPRVCAIAAWPVGDSAVCVCAPLPPPRHWWHLPVYAQHQLDPGSALGQEPGGMPPSLAFRKCQHAEMAHQFWCFVGVPILPLKIMP